MTLIDVGHGLFAMVDDADAPSITAYRWHVAGPYVYRARLRAEGHGKVALHRQITGAPPGQDVDHIDGNPLNNQRANLRVCSHRDNRRNSKVYANSASGKKGVRLTRYGTWEAYITIDGKWHALGTFADKQSAADAYDEAAVQHFGEFARTNKSIQSVEVI